MSLREAVHRVEEGLIALILGVMTILTFVQVVLRYVFNSGIIWQLEANYYLFSVAGDGWHLLLRARARAYWGRCCG